MPTVPDIHRKGTRAAQTAVPVGTLTVGTLWFVSDESLTERWTGTVWESYSGPSAGGAPALHAATHQAGGTDPLALDTLAAPTDIVTLNASSSAHGLLPKLSGVATDTLKGDGTWSAAAAAAHAASHANGGSDEISVGGLSGLLADGQTPLAHATTHNTGGADAITALSGSVITTGTVAAARLPARVGAVGLVIDGGGSVITTGVKGDLYVPFACTITASTLIADQTGSVVLNVLLSASYATTPTVSIVASAPPTLAAAAAAQDTTLAGWTVSVSAGSRLRVTVTSVSTITRLGLTLTVQA